jgi:acetoin utilization deacetylase AcuC-like enzyme
MTILFTDPIFLRHETGRHFEVPGRLRSITTRLDTTGLANKCSPGAFKPAIPESLYAIHDPAVVQRAREMADGGGGMLDSDTVVSRESYHVALAAAGACVAAVDAVIKGPDKTALCLVRPPGHHATPTTSMGFCLFNNIAAAANHARTAHGLSRILIIDWDVHHGNGTQDIFFADPGVFFFSIHRYGMGFYPGTGAADETGTGKGLGMTLNAPIRLGVSPKEYHAHFAHFLEKAADAIKPELVLVSAGFDAHVRDPIGSLGLDTEDFTMLTRQVLEVAKTHAHGRLVSCLEGGYHLEALTDSVEVHLQELLAHQAAG